MKFSIIIPSYNQPQFIERTFKNVADLKVVALRNGHELEVLLFDSCSDQETQEIIKKYESLFDVMYIRKDKGQHDAINKGIKRMTGTYWTWLNTDDYIDKEGFIKLAEVVSKNPQIDYIYGSIDIIDEQDQLIRKAASYELTQEQLLNKDPSIFQPGSFTKTAITRKIGSLSNDYQTSFDYEYVLRLFANKALVYKCDFTVAQFRYYNTSKSGSMVPVFIREQLKISKKYGRRPFSFMSLFLNLRLLKHKLFPR